MTTTPIGPGTGIYSGLYQSLIAQQTQAQVQNFASNPVQTTQNVQNAEGTETKEKKPFSKIKIAAVIAGAAAIAGAVVYAVKHMNVSKLSDITFSNGIASKGEEKFTGVVKDTLKNGDKIVLNYKDGVIQKSKKYSGKKKVLEKVFDYFENETNVVTKNYAQKKKTLMRKAPLENGMQQTRIAEGNLHSNYLHETKVGFWNGKSDENKSFILFDNSTKGLGKIIGTKDGVVRMHRVKGGLATSSDTFEKFKIKTIDTQASASKAKGKAQTENPLEKIMSGVSKFISRMKGKK